MEQKINPWLESLIEQHGYKWISEWKKEKSNGSTTPLKDYILVELDKEVMRQVNDANLHT